MATRKMKRYAEGDIVEGENPNIDDETRARARKYVDTSDEMYSDTGSKKGFGAAGTKYETVKSATRPDDAIDLPSLPAMSKSLEDAPKPKANIVTKEELAKSGLSLRDYMNKQQGLTRRGSSASSEKTLPKIPDRMSTTDTGDELGRLARFKKPPLRQETMRERAESYNRKRGIPGYKEGGTTRSSASKRADGIAIRGKTRI